VTSDEVIAALGLVPHPEGGHFRETFRDARVLADGRNAVTAIYFLLDQGEISRWHRVDASEIWLWHAGAPIELRIKPPDSPTATIRLGPKIGDGEAVQGVVPAHAWQQAEAREGWALVSCVVAPGFTFDGFELAPTTFDPTIDSI
jgi:predicted cupin superfamily sugar epimerase